MQQQLLHYGRESDGYIAERMLGVHFEAENVKFSNIMAKIVPAVLAQFCHNVGKFYFFLPEMYV